MTEEETKKPKEEKEPSVAAQRLYHLSTQFQRYHDVYYKTKQDEFMAATSVENATASDAEYEKYRKFEKNKLRANWFTGVQGFAYLLLNELDLDRTSEHYLDFSKRLTQLKMIIDQRRGTGLLIDDSTSQEVSPLEGTIQHKITAEDVELADKLIEELLQEYLGCTTRDAVDAVMKKHLTSQSPRT